MAAYIRRIRFCSSSSIVEPSPFRLTVLPLSRERRESDPQSSHDQHSPLVGLQRLVMRLVEAWTAHFTWPFFSALGARQSVFWIPARAISCSAEGATVLANFQPIP
jgi:hypothetical protein